MEEMTALLGPMFQIGWTLVVQVGVPIAAAGVAALVVVRQIQQLDRHRSEDRRTEGVLALTDLLTREVSAAFDPNLTENLVAWQFRNNEPLVRAYALLPAADAPVGRWVAQQRDQIRIEIRLALEAGEFVGDTVGPHRSAAGKIAAETMEKLLDWQRNDVGTRWFLGQLRA